jgi:hypothetical protein
MLLHYRDHSFEFVEISGSMLERRFILDAGQMERLGRLHQSEPEEWCIDKNGDRLPPDRLFELSPWSWNGPNGTVKLLARFINFNDGTAIFSTPDNYQGGLFDWMQNKPVEKTS